MFATTIITGILLALVALMPGQALAQVYRPHQFDLSSDVARLEVEDGFNVYGERRAITGKVRERQSTSWTMYGRVGPVSVEKDDADVTFRRGGGPKLGRLTFGLRKRF